MKISSLISIIFAALTLIIVSGCSTDSGFSIQEPTFDSVPDPYETAGVDEETVVDGITKLTVEEGIGVDRVVIRDQISMYITLRAEDGTIIFSSYQNNSTSPVQASIQNITSPTRPIRSFSFDRARTEGLRKGLIGMKEGEKRVIFVPPSQGFESVFSGSINEPYREDTLRYDVELDFIF